MADRRSVGWSQYNGLDSGDELSSINVTIKYETQVRFYSQKRHMLHKDLLVNTLIYVWVQDVGGKKLNCM